MKKLIGSLLGLAFAAAYGFAPDYPEGVRARNGEIIPEPLVQNVFVNTFSKLEDWEVKNFENHAKIAVENFKGRQGVMLRNNMGKKGDTAWMLSSKVFSIPANADSFRLEFKLLSNMNLARPSMTSAHGTRIAWLNAAGEEIGKKVFTCMTDTGVTRYNVFWGEIPKGTVSARIDYGMDNPNIDVNDFIFLDDISLGVYDSTKMKCRDGQVTSGAMQLTGKPNFNADCVIPKGCGLDFFVSTTDDNDGMPNENGWSQFRKVENGKTISGVRENSWIRWQARFKPNGTEYPVLKSVSIGEMFDSDWTEFAIPGTPVMERVSVSPTADCKAPFVFKLSGNKPINTSTVKVKRDGTEVKFARNKNVYSIQPPDGGFSEGIHKIKVYAEATDGSKIDSELWFRCGQNIPGPNVTLRDDGMTLLNGKPFFPIGIYSISKRKFNNFSFDEAFRGLKEGGFNLAHTYTATKDKEFFDAAKKHDIKLFTRPYDGEIFDMLLKYDNIIAWYLGDDTSAYDTPENVFCRKNNYASVDPTRISTQADGARGYFGFEKSTDSFLPEIYPVRADTPDTAKNCVADVVDAMETSFDFIKSKKAYPRSVWPIIQYMEGWSSWKRFPTERELRAMSWAAIACGAHGITWYTYAPGSEKNHGAIYTPETWRIMTDLSKEIAELQDVLVERQVTVPKAVVISGPAKNTRNHDSIVMIAKKHYDETWLFIVNTVLEDVKAQFTVPGCKSVSPYKENRAIIVNNGTFTENFEPYGVRILIAQ